MTVHTDASGLDLSRFLRPGDRIVIEGLQHAKPGEKVQIDDSPLPLAQATGQ